MSKKEEQSDLGISLKEVALILQSGKKLTRGAKTQMKMSNSEKQMAERQSQMSLSFDSKRSIQTKKEAHRPQKGHRRKEPSPKSSRLSQISQFYGQPCLESYILSQTLQLQTTQNVTRLNLSQLNKTHLTSMVRVFIKHSSSYEVKRGQLKKQKNNKEQFLVEQILLLSSFNLPFNSGNNRSDVRAITKQNGIVLVPENIVMIKVTFQDFKLYWEQQIQERKHCSGKKGYFGQGKQRIKDQMEILKIIQQEGEKRLMIPQEKHNNACDSSFPMEIQLCGGQTGRYRRSSDQMKQGGSELSFVQIQNKHQSSRSFNRNDLHEQQQIIYQQEQEKQKRCDNLSDRQEQPLSEQGIFGKFCIPGCDYILWPAIIYEPVTCNGQQLIGAIEHNKYFMGEKESPAMSLFQSVSKANHGLFQPLKSMRANQQLSSQSLHNCPIEEQIIFSEKNSETLFDGFVQHFNSKVKNLIQVEGVPITSQQADHNGDQSAYRNVVVHLLGGSKFICISKPKNQLSRMLVKWNALSSQWLNFYMLNTYFKEISEQVSQTIDRLNDFTRLQVSQCKVDDVRMAIDRLAKCSIQNKVHIGMPLRYSNIQKKILMLVFKTKESTENYLTWLNIQQVYPNWTVPQISLQNKFLLYFTKTPKPSNIPNTLSSLPRQLPPFIMDIYSTYFYRQFSKILRRNYMPALPLSQKQINYTSSSQFNILNRCVECCYPIYKMEHYQCFFCLEYCHKECSNKVMNRALQIYSSKSLQACESQQQTQVWTCNVCEPCTLCLQPLGQRHISCTKCQNMFHQVCGKLKTSESPQLAGTTHRDNKFFLCQNCIQCRICQKKLKNLDYFMMIAGGYQCVNCHKAQQANEICHICKKQGDGKWAQCSREFCGKWIHKNCDRYIQSRNCLWNNNQQCYFCPFCRKVQKRKIILKCIQTLTVFDEYQYFIGSDYEEILDYRYVINKPMCFRKMYERCLEGGYDENAPQSILQDFQLIVSNALKYNMPKDQPHYQARILNILGRHVLQKFREQLQCSQEEIIEGLILPKIAEKRQSLYRQVYEHYLQIILNYNSTNSVIEVKKPKQTTSSKHQEKLQHFDQPFVFSSRYLLNQVFKSSMLKFKLSKKAPTIENLFQIQKVIEAYRSPIKQNLCYYHYWNSSVIFYCETCLQYYCCTTRCYKHDICSACGMKGCACDSSECGCPQLKQKQRKVYEKLILDKYYDKRQITQNFKLCLRCAWEKLNSRVCTYCEKAYEFYYDFQSCKSCGKIYHKQCADVHASENLSKFFFKKDKDTAAFSPSSSQPMFSNSLRLDTTCYECSINRSHKPLMFQKLKSQSLSKLIKLQKLCKYQLLIASIYVQNGIKLSLNDILNIILSDYEQFLQYQFLFQEYRLNMASIRLNNKLYRRVQQKTAEAVRRREQNNPVLSSNQSKQTEPASILQFLSTNTNNDQPQQRSNYTQFMKYHLMYNSSENRSGQAKKAMIREFILGNQVAQGMAGQNAQQSYRRLKTQLLLQKFSQTKMAIKMERVVQWQTRELILSSVHTISSITRRGSLSCAVNPLSTTTRSPSSAVNFTSTRQSTVSNSNKSIASQDTANNYQVTIKQLTSHLNKYSIKSFIQLRIQAIEQIRYLSLLSNQNKKGLLVYRNHFNDFLAKLQTNKINSIVSINKNNQSLSANYPEHSIQNSQEQLSKKNNSIICQCQNAAQSSQQQVIQVAKTNQTNPNNKNQLHMIDIGEQIAKIYQQENEYEQQTAADVNCIQDQLMKLHCNDNNSSRLSKLKRLATIHQIISKFLLRCFELSKSVYRRGNTCILKSDVMNWRVLKKGHKKNQFYQISLVSQENKWFLSINQVTWWITSIQQIISKLQSIAKINNFRQLADFLGFTFKPTPFQKALHFTKFLRQNPLDNLNVRDKKRIILDVYERYQWSKNGMFRLKRNQKGKEFVVTKKKLYYLSKRRGHAELQSNTKQKQARIPPYITYQDLKKDLEDVSVMDKQKNQKIYLSQPGDNVFIAPSPIHKLGLFSKHPQPKKTTMVQYIGQIVSQSLADVRQSKFHFGCYMFGLNRRNLDRRQIIDATFRGNMARYLNHSCQANCKARIQVVNNHPRIFIYSIRDIEQYEQLTYDYQFSVDANQKLICTCGAKNCQGRLN